MSAPNHVTHVEHFPRHSRLARYGLWQLRDYAIGRGAPPFLIALVFGALAVVPMLKQVQGSIDRLPPLEMARLVAKYGSVENLRAFVLHDMGRSFLMGFVWIIVYLGAMLAMSGLVSNDRKLGYYRFLFSKPVSPVRFYGQAFVVHWGGFLLMMSVLAAIYAIYVEWILTPAFLLVIGLVYLLFAGLGFLMSITSRWDWLGLTGIVIAAKILWGLFGDSTNILAKLLYVLPPIHRTDAVFAAAIRGTALPVSSLAWIAGYGLACLAAGLAVLRTQRLAIT